MSSPPPTKPPRGVKQGKETSGLLMSVIRTLSASETNEQREKERAKLEKEYKKSDARLDELVAEHAQEIMDVMQKFNQVSAALSTWGQHCDGATARLAACRGLLRLRRQDLRRLWADARTHHHALNMLTDIERVVVSEREVREHVSAGRVLAAASTLRAALHTAETALAHVHALHTTRQHLQAKKNELVDVIIRRLSDAVYRGDRAFTRRLSARRRAALLLAELTKTTEVTDEYLQDITPEFEASLSEEDSNFETTVMISLEALGVLDQLKEATEKFKCQIQNELLEVIDTVSARVIEDVDADPDAELEEDGEMPEPDGVTETGRPLARLVTNLGEEFRACGARNSRLVQVWRAALSRRRLSTAALHTDHHYWGAVQQVLQLLLTEYLEIEHVSALRGAAAAPPAPDLRLADYFAKKRPQRRREKLFSLAGTLASTPAAAPARASRRLVCARGAALLHAALPALHALCRDIEPLLGGGECSLRAFITDYVRTGESERLAAEARAQIDAAMRAPSAWRERHAGPPPPEGLPLNSKLHRHRLVFACVHRAWEAARLAARAARRCGACGGPDAARALHSAIAAIATHCRVAQTRVSGGGGGGGGGGGAGAGGGAAGGSRAARWLSDDDIVRFLQALPHWRLAVAEGKGHTSAQELNQAYEREAEILGSSLGDGTLTRNEIISDVNTLADLAVLCESMDWLSANIRSIPALLGGGGGAGGGVKLSDKALGDIQAAASIFDEIAHKSLLLLHLELRIECFYYLCSAERSAGAGGAGGAGADSEGGEGGAGRLARALLSFHEHAANVLAPQRLAYILHGIGEMMSAAVIWRWQGGDAGGDAEGAGASRLGTLRHALAALQLPHQGLQRAHHYMALLNQTPEEIIATVRTKGAQFSELEYLNAFKVIGQRRGTSDSDMRGHLKRLSQALGHVGVTV